MAGELRWLASTPALIAAKPDNAHALVYFLRGIVGGLIWFQVNFLIVESVQRFHHYYGTTQGTEELMGEPYD